MDRSVRGARYLLLFAATATLAACQSIELGDAGALAKAGQQSSQQMSQFYSETRETLPLVLEIEVLRSALQPGVSPPSPQMEASIAKIRQSLKLREKLANDLSGLYSSMYELAATDYAGGFQAASQNLFGTIDGLASAAGVSNPLSAAQVDFAAGLAGRLITAKQKQKVAIANDIVLLQLGAVQSVLADERRVMTSVRAATSRQLEEGGIALWNAGTLSAKPLLSRYANVSGLVLTGSEADFTAKNPQLRGAVPALIRYRFRQINSAEEARYDAMTETVNGLMERHRELKEGAPINLEWLLGQVAKLQALKEDLKALRAAA